MVEDHSNRLYFHNLACNNPLDYNRIGCGSTLSSIVSIYGCDSISLPHLISAIMVIMQDDLVKWIYYVDLGRVFVNRIS
jgi:hypothetical protein